MKQPKKLTLEQKKALKNDGENWKEWMLLSEDNISWCFIHKETQKRKVLFK